MNSYMYPVVGFASGIHAIGSLLLFCGIILLLAWAIKHLHAAEQKKWGIVLVAVGVVLCLLSVVGSMRKAPARNDRRTPAPIMKNAAMSARSAMMQASSKSAAR